MTEAFGEKYAIYYDLLYKDKDYEAECRFIESILQKYATSPVKEILDAGCGTGGHAIPLAKRGYRITGIDASQDMVAFAARKAREVEVDLRLHRADLRRLDLGQTFEAGTCMFNVLGYLRENKDLELAFNNLRRHLKRDGLLIFDFWNGLAVLRLLPSTTVKRVEDKGRRIFRVAQPKLDAYNHLCHVHYHIIVTQDNAQVDEMEETHTVRYFFPQELAHYLELAHFKLLKMCPFLDLEGEVNENIWNVAAVARAI